EAIPDEWGQAAFVSALVEGLAGVVDKSVLYRHVELSPRWYFAGINKISVKVGYGSDGNQVNYSYAYKKDKKEMTVSANGLFDHFTLRLPFPEGTKNATATLDNKDVPVTFDSVNGSKYAVITGEGSDLMVVVKFL
ncbi:MAG TPA: hypothetical protein VE870_13460, partial [Bacteroidales bacterium]|nr:hypothetical protein [Bacteroidales bacterium]